MQQKSKLKYLKDEEFYNLVDIKLLSTAGRIFLVEIKNWD